MTDLTVANTILEQLGGRVFRAMTGATAFVGDCDSLKFRIPLSNGINCVKITLLPGDTYMMQFFKIWGRSIKLVGEEMSGIYFDQLQDIFTEKTGLLTHL